MGLQEFLLAFLAVASYGLTPKNYHDRNKFSFSPIIEVAVVFAGIFITMAPALLILNSWGEGDRQVFGMNCGLAKPWHFFWATGCLSSFLDNAPTYLTFAATACGLKDIPLQGAYLLHFLSMRDPIAVRLLQAISCGSVMMGANTYIGNGPNFMVKAIVEQHGVKMPSFFEYMAYSGVVLIPLFVVVTLFFFL